MAYRNETSSEGPQRLVHPYDEAFIVLAANARFFAGDTAIDATAGERCDEKLRIEPAS